MEKLSIAIVTLNEEERLPKCLKNLSFADEITLIDSGSTDKTREIANSYGCRVIEEPWRGYAEQKQYAVDMCKNNWVLILDADEIVPAETAREIQNILSSEKQEYCGYSLLRKNYFHGRWIKRCGWWPERVLRLVDRRRGDFNNRLVHESWVCDGGVSDLEHPLKHYSFRNYSDLIHKLQTYSTLAAEEMNKQKIKASPWTSIGHGVWMFIRTYIIELGLLEGFDGFVISLLNGGGSFMKYAKLWEVNKQNETDSD